MAEGYSDKNWDGRTDGTPWMQRNLIKVYRFIPLWLLYGIMALVIPFYMLFDRRAYRASYSFYRNRIGRNPVYSFLSVYLAEYHLGQVVLDRFAMYSGKHFDITVEGMDRFLELAEGDGGFVQLSSHIGNYELAGYSLISERKKFYALVFSETETVMKNRSKMFEKTNIEMIPVSNDMSHIFALNNALADGDIVSMAADRVFGSQKAVHCSFFGEDAAFPAGPFVLAAQREAPVLAVFVMKESFRGYRIFVNRIDSAGMSGMKRQERVDALASEFASTLEKTVRRYPTQWYNFFDFWNQ